MLDETRWTLDCLFDTDQVDRIADEAAREATLEIIVRVQKLASTLRPEQVRELGEIMDLSVQEAQLSRDAISRLGRAAVLQMLEDKTLASDIDNGYEWASPFTPYDVRQIQENGG
jgi:hypothetical protein